MPDTTCHMSISLDGFVAGPDQSRENPLGKRGREVHSWHLGDERANDADATAEGWLMRPRGAYVMGRNMFGPIRGEWEEDWRGWWGPEPPYHAPVFVLTHHAREPIEMEGGTTFHFVTDGIDNDTDYLRPDWQASHFGSRHPGIIHFAYADGTPYFPFGTTCYAWAHQGDAMEEETLATLRTSPFNKIRMCVFPKHYEFNHNEPELYVFPRTAPASKENPQGTNNYTRFEPAFFAHFEKLLTRLRDLNIEADLILFHPYDRWGYATMPAEVDERYLRYVIARFAAYRNVWWSLANEFAIRTAICAPSTTARPCTISRAHGSPRPALSSRPPSPPYVTC